MRCPRCQSSVLEERDRDGVVIDVCKDCRGIWLDRSELERLIARAIREQEEDELERRAPRAGRSAPPRERDEQRPAPGGYYHEDTPPHGWRRTEGYSRRKRHWFESLADIFD
jgi:Zn-finger nucleic acid-binding protein